MLQLIIALFAAASSMVSLHVFAAEEINWSEKSSKHNIMVTIYPANGTVVFGKYHDWIVLLQDQKGNPVYPASLRFSGAMPEHGHGMPSAPIVSHHLSDGRYQVEGVRFNMTGNWELTVDIRTATLTDRVEFAMNLTHSTLVDSPTVEWSDAEKQVLASLSFRSLGALPDSPSNKVADHPDAVEFGKALFHDTRLSGNQRISCASCHQEKRAFTDGLTKSSGIGETLRNSPTLLGAAFNTWYYWDGRRDSLWAQALVPIEAADELGGSRTQTLRLINATESYKLWYQRIFAAEPPPKKMLIKDASPYGNKIQRDHWQRMSNDKKHIINRAFSRVGKVIAAYERTLLPRQTRVDRYIDAVITGQPQTGENTQLNMSEVRGLKLFIDNSKTGCVNCHNGPRLTNDGFHNIGTGNFDGERLDFGRMIGIRSVQLDEFNCFGRYSDTVRENCDALRFLNNDAHTALQGAFKVPTLRNIGKTAPYMHDGSLPTLDSVLHHYQSTNRNALGREFKPLNLSSQEIVDLSNLLKVF